MKQNKWRLIKNIEDNAFMQMAIDEAILEARAENKVLNTLRFYSWKPKALSIGYFQSLDKEVDQEKASSLGVDIVRRMTGGGAVYHDDELTYSFIASEKDVPADIIQSYDLICKAVIGGLKKSGINASFRPINDIIVDGRKISGNAQTRKKGVVLQHGTILLSVDAKTMFSLLKVPDEKLRDKKIKALPNYVVGTKELNNNCSFSILRNTIIEGFKNTFETDFDEQNLNYEELNRAKHLAKEKYSTKQWLNKR